MKSTMQVFEEFVETCIGPENPPSSAGLEAKFLWSVFTQHCPPENRFPYKIWLMLMKETFPYTWSRFRPIIFMVELKEGA